MDPRRLVRSLEAEWQDVLDAVLKETAAAASSSRRPAVSTRDIARLAPMVEELSRAYNAGLAEGRTTKLPIEARIAFSFPRDVPKGAGAVRELVSSGALSIPKDRALRIVDLGAGLGAMTWGVVRALEAAGAAAGATAAAAGQIEALLVDEDPQILDAAERIARAVRAARAARATRVTSLHAAGQLDLNVTTQVQSLRAFANVANANQPVMTARTADVVLVGQVLSEIDPQSDPETRIALHTALLKRLLESVVSEDGALVVIEPALRERTRILHAVRDRILETMPSASVFAPCLHQHPCPALATPSRHGGEWCHEDLAAVDLPSWVVPLARAAGLRWQGLTFSYLVLRKDGRRLFPSAAQAIEARLRVISDLLRSKGKTELFACTEEGLRARIRRLDRDAGTEEGVAFGDLMRGDIVSLHELREVIPPPCAAPEQTGGGRRADQGKDVPKKEEQAGPIDARGRVKPHVAIDVGAFGEDERVGGLRDARQERESGDEP